jgi:glycerol-3-phosphate acyltransferase PlsY
MLVGVAAVVGHNWSIFTDFRGGRGEATTIGIFLTVLTKPTLLAVPLALITLFRTKNVVSASAVLFILVIALTWGLGFSGHHLAYSIILPTLVGLTHYARTRQKIISIT